jgi:hypothetical protein
MKYRKLDADGDFQFGNGNADFHKDTPETVAQAVVTRLLLWAAEWFLDTTDGTPYQAGVLGKNNQITADAVMRERILGTTGVTAITEFSSFFNPDLRNYSISATIDTVFGAAKINEIL